MEDFYKRKAFSRSCFFRSLLCVFDSSYHQILYSEMTIREQAILKLKRKRRIAFFKEAAIFFAIGIPTCMLCDMIVFYIIMSHE